MVLPTPFERLMQETVQLANRDPQGAFARLDELFGKSLSEQDVHQLGAFSVHLGVGGLGRYDETAAFQRRLLKHPALRLDGPIARSLWRGLAVTLICAGQHQAADEATKEGVGSPSEICRLAIMTAQMLSLRGRANEAITHLRRASLHCRDLDPNDEVVAQTAAIAGNLAHLTEPHVRLAQELLLAAAAANSAALSHSKDWRVFHRAWFQHGQAYLLAAKPAQALRCVQRMMEMEDLHQAGPIERFFTASLACRAQAIRSQFKIAAGALEACQDFAKRVEDPEQAKQVAAALGDLEKFVATMREE